MRESFSEMIKAALARMTGWRRYSVSFVCGEWGYSRPSCDAAKSSICLMRESGSMSMTAGSR